MAKQTADTYTLDLLDRPKRGRPRKPDAKTPAQRAREYRARRREAVRQALQAHETRRQELDAWLSGLSFS
jgi:hypothetical protein